MIYSERDCRGDLLAEYANSLEAIGGDGDVELLVADSGVLRFLNRSLKEKGGGMTSTLMLSLVGVQNPSASSLLSRMLSTASFF